MYRHNMASASGATHSFFDTGTDAAALSERPLQHGVIVKPWKQDGYQSFIRIGTRAEIDHFLTALDHSHL